MVTHSSILAWRISWTEEPGGLQSMASHRVRNDQATAANAVKGFSVINETEVDVFLELSCFLHNPTNVDNLISGSSAFSKPSSYIWKFLVHILLKPSLYDFDHALSCMLNGYDCAVFEQSLALPLFGIGMKIDHFQSCGHC